MYKPLIVLIALILMLSFSFADLTTNLEAYYSMDETSGTTMIDDTGTINGTLIGGLPTTSNGLIDRGYGVFSNGKYAQISPPASMQFSDSTSFSVCSWLKGTLTHYEGIEKVVDACGVLTWQLIPAANGYTKFRMTRDCGGSNTITSSVAATTTDWYMVCSTYDGSTKAMILYQDGVNRGSTTFGTTASASSGVIQIGRNPRFGDYYDGYYDEVGIWSRVLTPTEITELYNSGDGFTYPFTEGVDANFGYVIDKTNAQVILTDTSPTFGATSITSWTWKNGDTNIGFTKDFNYPTTQLTDLNIGLYVDTNNDLNDIQYYAFNTGEWTAPVTTFSSHQVTGTTDQNIILTCTDNNSGCKYINYNIDANVWIQKTYTDANRIFTYPGGGVHSIQYFSTDNADNNETTKTSQFTTYGIANFGFYDENNLAELDGITYTISPSINGNSGATLIDNNLDLNLQGLTSGTYTFTFSLPDYGTRYYFLDINQYANYEINMLLLEVTRQLILPFKFYMNDGNTLANNGWAEMYRPDRNNFSIGRVPTSSSGLASFSIDINDQNYIQKITNSGGDVNYAYPVRLLIYKPRDESTSLTIDGNWNVLGPTQSTIYIAITGNQSIWVLPNLSNVFSMMITDSNLLDPAAGSLYFPRTYTKSYPGNPLTDTLQPYLIGIIDGDLIKFFVQNELGIAVPNITINISKLVNGAKTLVTSGVTDSSGEFSSALVVAATYYFDLYANGKLLAPEDFFYLQINESSYYFTIGVGYDVNDYAPLPVSISWNPPTEYLYSQTILTQNISGTGIAYANVNIYQFNDDGNVKITKYTNFYDCAGSCIISQDIGLMVAPDVNKPFFVDVNLYSDNNILGYSTTKRYKFQVQGAVDLLQLLFNVRRSFGCMIEQTDGTPFPGGILDYNYPCAWTTILSILLAIFAVGGMIFTIKIINPYAMGMVGGFVLIFFAMAGWFYWPLLFVIGILLILGVYGRRGSE